MEKTIKKGKERVKRDTYREFLDAQFLSAVDRVNMYRQMLVAYDETRGERR